MRVERKDIIDIGTISHATVGKGTILTTTTALLNLGAFFLPVAWLGSMVFLELLHQEN